jgi:hypothetical protein
VRAFVAVIVLAACTPTRAMPEDKRCTPEEASQAEGEAVGLVTWTAVRDSFRRFGHCDDGAIAEGYSHAVVGMLADRWSQLRVLEKLLPADPAFRGFVLHHIDATAEQGAFNRLVANAAVRCPAQSVSTCQAILNRAREVQHEQSR